MKILNFKTQLCLRTVFCIIFCSIMVIEASAMADSPIPIVTNGNRATMTASITAGFAHLNARRENGDTIAADILKSNPANLTQQKDSILRYNESLAQRNAQLKLEQIQKDVASGRYDSINKLAPMLADGSIGYDSSSTAAASSSRSLRTSYDGGESGDGSDSLDGTGIGGSGSGAVMAKTASFGARKEEAAREFAAQFKKDQDLMGQKAIDDILRAEPVGSGSGNPVMALQMRSYREAMISIMQQMINKGKAEKDSQEVLSIQRKIDSIAPGPIADAQVEAVVDLMKDANHIVSSSYLKKPLDMGEIRTRMERAAAASRRKILNYYFNTIFIPATGEESSRLEEIQHIAMSLKCTNAFEELITTLQSAKVFSAKDCDTPFEYLGFARERLLKANQEADQATLRESLPCYEFQLQTAAKYASDEIEKTPLSLILFINPRAIFLLKNEKGQYTDFGRIENDLQYLNTEQQKALFYLLYQVDSRFSEWSDWYTAQTFSKPPVQKKDILDLINEIRVRLKYPSTGKKFVTAKKDREDLVKFAISIQDLVSGKTFKESVVRDFKDDRKSVNKLLKGITHEGLTACQQPPLMHDVLDLVNEPDGSFPPPASEEDFQGMATLVQKLKSVGNLLRKDDALVRLLQTSSKVSASAYLSPSASTNSLSSLSPSHSPSPSVSVSPLSSIGSNGGMTSSVSSKPVARIFGGGQLAAFGTMASRKNLNFASVADAQVALDQYKVKFAAQRSTLHPDIVQVMEEDIQKVDAAIAADKLLLATPLLGKIAGILDPAVAPKFVISKKPPAALVSGSSSVMGPSNPPSAPPLAAAADDLAAPVASKSSAAPVALSAAQQKAAAQKATQLHEINKLEEILQAKKGIISADDYSELEATLAAVRSLTNVDNTIAVGSIKLRGLKSNPLLK